ncbi:MAG: glycosyltransferase family 9 protein [Alphaproteobacteria bacterium]|nr:glycosyltransferase family 9 protein [Alphaproteobacteria bacterium]
MPPERILVIKLGALGDFIQALGPAAAIRRHHPDSEITLLTTAPFAALASASGLFDRVWLDDRPKLTQPGRWLALRHRLNMARFRRVYDLQTSDRSGWYFRLLAPKPEWSGIARGCSHPHANPRRDFMHTIDRQAEQLHAAGIDQVPLPDLSFLQADVERFGLPQRYALLVPGGAAHRPAKRWPTERYAALARSLGERDIQPALLGTAAESGLATEIVAAAPVAADLTGQTSLADIAVLARSAVVAVGNDTGPMHLIAASGCPAIVLFSAESDPALCAPRGPAVTVLRQDDLAQLETPAVVARLPQP